MAAPYPGGVRRIRHSNHNNLGAREDAFGLLARRISFHCASLEQAALDAAFAPLRTGGFAGWQILPAGYEVARRAWRSGVRTTVAVAVASFVVRAVEADGDEWAARLLG